jgi:hypothetical protein
MKKVANISRGSRTKSRTQVAVSLTDGGPKARAIDVGPFQRGSHRPGLRSTSGAALRRLGEASAGVRGGLAIAGGGDGNSLIQCQIVQDSAMSKGLPEITQTQHSLMLAQDASAAKWACYG